MAGLEMTIDIAIAVFAIQLAANLIKAVAGFGSGVISGPLLSLWFNPSTVTPALSMIDFPVNGYIAWKERHYYSVKKYLPYGLVVVAGVLPGVLLLKASPSWIIKLLLGLFVVVIGIKMLARPDTKVSPRIGPLQYLVFFASGVSGGLFGINMFFLPEFSQMSSSIQEFRGSICFVYTLDTGLRIALFSILGMVNGLVVQLFLISLAGAVVGMLIGSRAAKKLPEHVARKLAIWVFIGAGVVIAVRTAILQA